MAKYKTVALAALFALAVSCVGATESALAALEVDTGYLNQSPWD